MAHRTEKEETTEFKNKVHEPNPTTATTTPTPLSLCINNCGVTGNPSTNNMCQNCFFNSKIAPTTSSSTSSICTNSSSSYSTLTTATKSKKRDSTSLDVEASDLDSVMPTKRVVNRCFGCKRKVGLTGFRCRCGELFCAEHRYSDRHDCSFDYKAAGREAIKRENPVVKAPKIVRV